MVEPSPSVTPPPVTGRYPALPILSTVELAKLERTQPYWLLYPYVVLGGMTVLNGFLKESGKTTLLLAWVKAWTVTGEFCGHKVEMTDVVLFSEQSPFTLEPTLQAAGLMNNLHLHILYYSDMLKAAAESPQGLLPWDEIVRQAVAKLDAVSGQVLILDTLAQFFGIHGEAENQAGPWLDALRPLQAAQADKRAIVWSRHEGLRGGTVARAGRGHTSASGIVDIILQLKRKPDTKDRHYPDNVRELNWTGRFTTGSILLALENGEYVEVTPEMTDDDDPSKQITLADTITDALPDGANWSIAEILKALPKPRGAKPPSYDTVEREVKAMVRAGQLVRTGEKYTGYRYGRRG
jgi:hypothetical protein